MPEYSRHSVDSELLMKQFVTVVHRLWARSDSAGYRAWKPASCAKGFRAWASCVGLQPAAANNEIAAMAKMMKGVIGLSQSLCDVYL